MQLDSQLQLEIYFKISWIWYFFSNRKNILCVISCRLVRKVLDWPNPSFTSLKNVGLIRLNVMDRTFWHDIIFVPYLSSQAEAPYNIAYRHKMFTMMNAIVSLSNSEFVWWQWICFGDFNRFGRFYKPWYNQIWADRNKCMGC